MGYAGGTDGQTLFLPTENCQGEKQSTCLISTLADAAGKAEASRQLNEQVRFEFVSWM